MNKIATLLVLTIVVGISFTANALSDIQGDVAIIGSNANVDNLASIKANSFTLDAAKEQSTHSKTESTTTVSSSAPTLNKNEVTVANLSETNTSTTETTNTTTWSGSSFNAGSLSVDTTNNVNLVSSDLNVSGDTRINAKDVIIGGRQDVTETTTERKEEIKTVSVGVKNAYVDTAQAIKDLNSAKNAVRDAEQAYDQAKQKVANGQMPASELDYYKTNIVAATANVTNAAIAVGTAGATAAGTTGTGGFYATGSASVETNESSSTTTDKTWNGSNVNIGGNANITADHEIEIKGSSLAVGGGLQLDADDINLLAGENSTQTSSDSSSHTETANYSTNGGPSGSLSANKTESSSESQYYTNTQITAGTLSSNSENLTLSGANVDAGVVDISTGNLVVESLQNTSTSNSQTQGVNLSLGGVAPPTSGGINQQQSESSSAWVDQQSSITGGNVSIKAKDTTLKGGLIAAVDENGNDNGQLTLQTDTLTVENIQDHDTSSDKGFNLNTGASTTTVGANYSGHDKLQTTKATIGTGNVQVGGNALAETDLDVNRDTNNAQEITKDHELGGLDATVIVDHRLASEEGRDKISEDFMKTDMLREAVERMVTTDRIGITDLNSEIGKQNNTYEAVKLEIAKDPILAAKLQSSDLNPEEKQHVLNQLTHTVMKELGYETEGYNNKVTANENSIRQGFYSEETGDAYINDAYIDDNGQLVETAGHEMAHAMDDRDGSNQQYSKEDRETYAHNIGEGLVDYTGMALDINGYNDGLAASNNHVGNDSALIITNNVEYSGLDKTKGDALLPAFVEDARKAVRDHQEKSQQASANLKGDGVGTALSMAAAAGDIVIDVTDAAVTIVDKTTDVIGAVGLFGGDLKAEALDNIARDLSSIESAYENKQEIATAILTKLQDYPNRLAEMDPSALRSLISVAGEGAIPAAIIAKVNKADVLHGPKPDIAIADNEVGHSALDQDPVVQALREKDRQGVDPNSTVDVSTDHEMIGQDAPTNDGVIEPSKFDGKLTHPSEGITGITFTGKVTRYEIPERIDSTWDQHEWNQAADHRYTESGSGGVYAGTDELTARKEIDHYNALDGRVATTRNVKLNHVLDLTNSNIRAKLGITLEDITNNSYETTQSIGKWAKNNNFDGILAPSARNPNGANIVILKDEK